MPLSNVGVTFCYEVSQILSPGSADHATQCDGHYQGEFGSKLSACFTSPTGYCLRDDSLEVLACLPPAPPSPPPSVPPPPPAPPTPPTPPPSPPPPCLRPVSTLGHSWCYQLMPISEADCEIYYQVAQSGRYKKCKNVDGKCKGHPSVSSADPPWGTCEPPSPPPRPPPSTPPVPPAPPPAGPLPCLKSVAEFAGAQWCWDLNELLGANVEAECGNYYHIVGESGV